MSAISFSNNYVSSTYYTSAKTQRVAATETTKSSNSSGDVLTISAEALEALKNNGNVLAISAEELEGEEEVKIEFLEKPKAQRTSSLCRYLLECSEHYSLMDWAFSITAKNKNDNGYRTYSDKAQTEITNLRNQYSLENTNGTYNIYGSYTAIKTQSELTNFRYQRSLENADETFAELLEKNGITLNEKEHIELTIDYDGKITVGGNISQEKSELIQNTLNNDKSLGQNLLMAHVNRNEVDMRHLSQPLANHRVAVNIILQQYGLSLSDFELNEDVDRRQNESCEMLKIKNGNDTLLKELNDSEAALTYDIYLLLTEQPDAVLPSTTFSYQNGVFVEKGENDAAALNAFASNAAKKLEVFGDKIDYSMTFNSNGEITDVADDKIATDRFGEKTLKEIILKYNEDSFDEDTLNLVTDGYFNVLILQQYAFDKKRLTQYETGANANDLDTFTVGKNEKGNFSIASNSTLLRQIIKSATENPTEKIIVESRSIR